MKKAFAISMMSFLLTGCASTSFRSTWHDRDMGPVEISGKKVVVVMVDAPRSLKLAVEASVADELNALGAHAVASNQVLPPESDKDAAKEKLAADGFETAVVLRVIDRQSEIHTTSSVYAPYPARRSFWGWGGGWGTVYTSNIHTSTKVTIETLVYSVTLDKLVWSGLSDTTNPSEIERTARELVRVALGEMKKSGLVR